MRFEMSGVTIDTVWNKRIKLNCPGYELTPEECKVVGSTLLRIAEYLEIINLLENK